MLFELLKYQQSGSKALHSKDLVLFKGDSCYPLSPGKNDNIQEHD